MIAVVVGAGPGMGAALARRFGREGATLALVARRQDSLDQQVGALRAAGIPAHGFRADVADEGGLRTAFAAIRAELGDPDVLLFNASLLQVAPPSSLTVDAAVAALRVGTLAFLVALQEVLPGMRAAGRGTVLATGGGTALVPWADGAALSLSKAALRSLVLAAADELATTGIHVATVTIAGTVGTEGFEPDVIAERYWALHAEPPGAWTAEIVHRGHAEPG